MEWDAYRQRQRAFGACRLACLDTSFDRRAGSCYHHLAWRVVIGCLDYIPSSGSLACLANLTVIQADDRGHAAFAYGYCRLHKPAALLNKCQRIAELQDFGSNQR